MRKNITEKWMENKNKGIWKNGKVKQVCKKCTALSMAFVMAITSGCGNAEKGSKDSEEQKNEYKYAQELNVIDDNVRTYYEVFVYSFYDSDGDGIGDLNGVTEKLDYIQDMGFNGIWLMPIMPSPSYHKYDTTDYCAVDSQYGTVEDFQKLLEECHKRDIRVIIDFMINHSSNQHTWFQTAYSYLNNLKSGEKPSKKDCPYIDYYHFVKEDEATSSYYQVGSSDWYYEGAFVDTMPDLNLNSKKVRGEIEEAAKFWLDMGVDGFRLDGVKFYTGLADTNIDILTWFNDYVKSLNKDAYIVSEVWDNYNVAAEYLKSGINSTFDFSTGQSTGTIVKYVRQSVDTGVGQKFADVMMNIENMTSEANPESTVAEFLTNHDTGRMANILGDETKVKVAYAMELLMAGNAFVYYGEEIGLAGAGSDPNFRAPMYWSATDNTGITAGPPEMDSFDNLHPAVDEQQKDENSILNFVKRCIRLRNENPEIARGTTEKISEVTDESICAITRTYEDSQIVLLYNLSGQQKTVTVSKDTYGYEGIRGYASTDNAEVTLDGDVISLPPYSFVILK